MSRQPIENEFACEREGIRRRLICIRAKVGYHVSFADIFFLEKVRKEDLEGLGRQSRCEFEALSTT